MFCRATLQMTKFGLALGTRMKPEKMTEYPVGRESSMQFKAALPMNTLPASWV